MTDNPRLAAALRWRLAPRPTDESWDDYLRSLLAAIDAADDRFGPVTEDEARKAYLKYYEPGSMIPAMQRALTAFLAGRGVAPQPAAPVVTDEMMKRAIMTFANLCGKAPDQDKMRAVIEAALGTPEPTETLLGFGDGRTTTVNYGGATITQVISPTQRFAQQMANKPPPPDHGADIRALAERVDVLERQIKKMQLVKDETDRWAHDVNVRMNKAEREIKSLDSRLSLNETRHVDAYERLCALEARPAWTAEKEALLEMLSDATIPEFDQAFQAPLIAKRAAAFPEPAKPVWPPAGCGDPKLCGHLGQCTYASCLHAGKRVGGAS